MEATRYFSWGSEGKTGVWALGEGGTAPLGSWLIDGKGYSGVLGIDEWRDLRPLDIGGKKPSGDLGIESKVHLGAWA